MRFTCKKILSLVLAVLVLMSLTACNNNDDSDTTNPKSQTARDTNAIIIGDHTLSAVELNYFYIDAINSYTQQYGPMISYILDTSRPLNTQIANQETGATWADNFLDMAKENIKSTYQLYDLAVKNGHKLTEEEQKSIDTMMANMEMLAPLYGFKDADAYLRNSYGSGADMESYRAYYEICSLASSYYNAHADSLNYDDADLRAYEQDKFEEYSSYSYIRYYLPANKFLHGGTRDENGELIYSAAEKQQAIEDCKQVALNLAAGIYTSKEAFDAAIKELEINMDDRNPTLSTENTDILYAKLNTLFKDWLTAEDRKAGDITTIVSESGTGANKTVNGYYVIQFVGVNDNAFKLKDVRHVLIPFEGGTYNPTTGQTTYTEAEKKAAKEKAEKLMAEWVAAGKLDEESFIELAKKNSKDGNAAEGGLYEDVYPGQMVKAFEEWCYDAEREHGNYGLVETEYGYHIMFFVGDSETTYRDFMLEADLKAEELEKWHEDLVKAAVLKELNLKYVEMDLILAA